MKPKYPRLHHAVNLATQWHTGQDRKYSQTPYIIHPLRVMEIVRSVSNDEDMLIAAVLHDVVEDTEIELIRIREEFGENVESLVADLTDIATSEHGNRKARKLMDREHTAQASPDAKTIKLADLIDNTESIVRCDPHFSLIYMNEKERLLEVLTEGDSQLWARAHTLLQEYQTSRLQEALR